MAREGKQNGSPSQEDWDRLRRRRRSLRGPNAEKLEKHETAARKKGLATMSHQPDGTLWIGLPLGDWEAFFRFVPQDGRPVVAELRVIPFPTGRDEHSMGEQEWIGEWLQLPQRGQDQWFRPPATPSGGLRARELRKLNPGQAVQEAYRHLEKLFRLDLFPDWIPATGRFDPEAVKQPRRPGRQGRDDRFYASVAAAYVEALEEGTSKPVVAAAEKLSRAAGGEYRDRYVRDLLSEARERGLLTRPPQGRAGGELTEKGRKALEGDEP